MSYKLLHNWASLPKTNRGRPTLLKGSPKGDKFLYCNGFSVFIRNVDDPSDCDIYTEHAKETTAACFAPSGFYIASGDASGKLRIWDTVNKEHILKYEYTVLGGAIKDIQWTEDSKRIVVGGEGRERFAHAIMWDTGTSVGTVSAHSAAVNQIDVKPNRPFRVVTASEDYKVAFFEGPPFKFTAQKEEHSNFVNCVRFSPDGFFFASGGADGKIFIYDGRSSELKLQLNYSGTDGKAHKGGVYGLSWSGDSTRLLSCSADKTCKVWDVKANTCLADFKFPDVLENQQVGCLWVGEHLLSLSLNGSINYLNIDNPSTPKRVIQGHNKGITALAISKDGTALFSGSSDGLIVHWEVNTGLAANVKGRHHTNMIKKLSCRDNVVVSCAMDDTVKVINSIEREYVPVDVGMPSQPQGVGAGRLGLVVVACLGEVVVVRNGKIVYQQKVDYSPSTVALHPDETVVAVGSSAKNKIHLYELNDDVLKDAGTIEANGPVTSLEYSPDGNFLASGDAGRALKIYDSSNMDYEEKNTWVYHSARVNCVAFSPGGEYIASCGVDGAIHVFRMDKRLNVLSIKGAHSPSGNVTSICWMDEKTIASGGQQDCSVRVWEITV